MSKFINQTVNFRTISCNFDKSCTTADFNEKMKELGMDDWKIMGGTNYVHFFRRPAIDYYYEDSEDEDSEED